MHCKDSMQRFHFESKIWFCIEIILNWIRSPKTRIKTKHKISKHSHTNWSLYKITSTYSGSQGIWVILKTTLLDLYAVQDGYSTLSAPVASEFRTISSTLLASSFPMPWKLCNISGARNRFHLPEDLPQVCWLCKTEISQHRLCCQDATQTTTCTAIKAVWTFTFVTPLIMCTGVGLWHTCPLKKVSSQLSILAKDDQYLKNNAIFWLHVPTVRINFWVDLQQSWVVCRTPSLQSLQAEWVGRLFSVMQFSWWQKKSHECNNH